MSGFITTTNENEIEWPYCDGGHWECPVDGLNWCTECNPTCERCGTPAPIDEEESE